MINLELLSLQAETCDQEHRVQPIYPSIYLQNTFVPIYYVLMWAETSPVQHYIDVIMTTMASQIISLTVVYSTVYSDADQRKHQSSASLAFEWGIHRDRWIPRTKGQLRGKCFRLMTSSWNYSHVLHEDVMTWKRFPHYWPFNRGIHGSRVDPFTND